MEKKGKKEKMDKLKTTGQYHWLRLKMEKKIQQIEFSNILVTWNCSVWWGEFHSRNPVW